MYQNYSKWLYELKDKDALVWCIGGYGFARGIFEIPNLHPAIMANMKFEIKEKGLLFR